MRWTDPITARRVPSKLRETNGEQEGMKRRESKKQGDCSIRHCNLVRVHKFKKRTADILANSPQGEKKELFDEKMYRKPLQTLPLL